MGIPSLINLIHLIVPIIMVVQATFLVKSLSRTYQLPLSSDLTVADVLLTCREKHRQTVVFQGKALPSTQLLQSAGVENGSILLLLAEAKELQGYMVFVRRNGIVSHVICGRETTVGDVKAECERALRVRRDLAIVSYHGSELPDSQVVIACVSGPIPELLLSKRPSPIIPSSFKVEVKTLTGKSIHITINSEMNVEDIKEIISDREGIPQDQIRLICEGHGLSDCETVEQLRMTVDSVIYLVLRLR